MTLWASPFGEPGVHGPARPREWDVVTSAEAPGLAGDEVRFSALPDGSLLVDEGAEAIEALAEAVERSLAPPYRAYAVRRSPTAWAVAAVATEVIELREHVEGDDVELVMREGERALSVDGERVFGSLPTLERYAEERHDSYVLRAERLEGDFWEVEILPL